MLEKSVSKLIIKQQRERDKRRVLCKGPLNPATVFVGRSIERDEWNPGQTWIQPHAKHELAANLISIKGSHNGQHAY